MLTSIVYLESGQHGSIPTLVILSIYLHICFFKYIKISLPFCLDCVVRHIAKVLKKKSDLGIETKLSVKSIQSKFS